MTTLPWIPLRLEVMAGEDIWRHYPLPVGEPITRDPEWESAFEVGIDAVIAATDALFPEADPWERAHADGDPGVVCAYDRVAEVPLAWRVESPGSLRHDAVIPMMKRLEAA